MMAAYLDDTFPRPKPLPSITSPMLSVNSQFPSDNMVILSALKFFPQASMTQGLVTEMQIISSTPLARISSAFSMYPGTWFTEQVGVNAPGTPISTNFLFF